MKRMLAALLTLFAAIAQAVVVTDERGVSVDLAQPPRRIVSLLPSLTESVCTLGACERIVGVDRYSNWPESVRLLPQVGGGIDPNLEAVVALRPDVVLLAESSRVTGRLEALGIKALVFQPKGYADVRRVLQALDRMLGTDDAQRVWRDINAEVSAAARSVPPEARQLRVYFEVNGGPFAASESSFIGETLGHLGEKNIVPASMGPFPKLNPEFVVRADPDLIMAGERGAQDLEQRPGWSRIKAVRDGRICRFNADESDVLVRPGPRMGEAAWLMARCLMKATR